MTGMQQITQHKATIEQSSANQAEQHETKAIQVFNDYYLRFFNQYIYAIVRKYAANQTNYRTKKTGRA